VPLLQYYDIDRHGAFSGHGLWDEAGPRETEPRTYPRLVRGGAGRPPQRADFSKRVPSNSTRTRAPPRLATLAYDADQA